MAKNLIEKLINEAVENNGTYAEFCITSGNVAFVSDAGSRRSTKNYKLDDKNIESIEKTIRGLDDRCLLFSGDLKKLKAVLRDGREYAFERKDKNHISIITGKTVAETKIKEYVWVRFEDASDRKYGVAFALKENKGKYQIQSCKGSVLNGSFDSGISTDLMFVISGEFYGKAAMPDTKYTETNSESAIRIGQILEKAIGEILHLHLLDMSLFSVLPSTMDEESEINYELIKAARRACDNNIIFKSRKGTIVAKHNIVFGTNEVTDLFSQDIAEPFLKGRYWIEKCTEGSREEFFLIDIGVVYYDRERFLGHIFSEEFFDDLANILDKQPDRWLRRFYIFCSAPIAEDKTKRKIVTGFKNIKSIRDSKGRMQVPSDISLLLTGEETTKKSVVVKNNLIFPNGNEDQYSQQIIDFFYNDLAVAGFSIAPEMKKLAEDLMKRKQPIDRLYCERLTDLARFDKDNSWTIDFGAYAIFPYESSRGLRRARACELVVGKPYVKEGNLLASAMNRKTLWGGIKKLVSSDDLSMVLDFAVRCGAVGKAVILKQPATEHISFSKTLYASGKVGGRDSNYDFTIPGLDDILRRRSLQLSKMVWTAILEAVEPDKVLYAEYSVDNRRIVNRDDSSLIKILRERTWVPGKDGKFYMPGNIAAADICDDLVYNRRNPILKQLHFGTEIKDREKELAAIKKHAEKFGLRLVSEEDYQEFLNWKKKKPENIT